MKKESNKERRMLLCEARTIFADNTFYTDSQILEYYRLLKAVCGDEQEFEQNSALAGGLNKALRELDERERHILWIRFCQRCTLEEAGEIYDVSRERARQIESYGLKLMSKNKEKFIIDEQIKFLGEKIKSLQSLKQGVLICNVEIERLRLSERSYNALIQANIKTVNDLLDYSKRDFSNIKGLGNVCAEEVIKQIQEYVPGWKPVDRQYIVRQLNSTETTKKYVDLPVEFLKLSKRSLNCMKRVGVRTIGDFLSFPEENLIVLKNFGEKSYEEIKKCKEEFKQI